MNVRSSWNEPDRSTGASSASPGAETTHRELDMGGSPEAIVETWRDTLSKDSVGVAAQTA